MTPKEARASNYWVKFTGAESRNEIVGSAYQASAPGEPPAQRTGRLRQSFFLTVDPDSHSGRFVANIRGTENLLFDMMLNPTFARDLFDRAIEEVLVPWILYQKAYFPAATNIVGSDASASVPILNPGMIQAWIVPDISRLRALCGPEIYVPNWVGEALLPEPEKMLDLKRQVAADFIEGQDPDVEVLGPERYLAYAQKHDLALLLGVGAAFMDASSPEAVADRVRHYIEVGKQHDRFAIFFCNLGATTPPENIRVAVETARSYGCYG
jgi:hypothetical protein